MAFKRGTAATLKKRSPVGRPGCTVSTFCIYTSQSINTLDLKCNPRSMCSAAHESSWYHTTNETLFTCPPFPPSRTCSLKNSESTAAKLHQLQGTLSLSAETREHAEVLSSPLNTLLKSTEHALRTMGRTESVGARTCMGSKRARALARGINSALLSH